MNAADTSLAAFRARAEAASAALPPLVLARGPVTASFAAGGHGLRRPGIGEDFWQYRLAHEGDTAAAIDWRRSARGDMRFVRDRERQTARTAALWVGRGAGMGYAGQGRDRDGATAGESKIERARLIALALALSLIRAGERVAQLGEPAGSGMAQATKLTASLGGLVPLERDADSPGRSLARRGTIAILLGDFLSDDKDLDGFLQASADVGSTGVLLQILHPDEEDFPFVGAIRFETAGGLRHDTRDAGGLQAAYRARLAERRATLAGLCADAGFVFGTHDLGRPLSEALIWLHGVLSAR